MTYTLSYDDEREIEKEACKVFVRIFAEKYIESLELDNIYDYSQKYIYEIYHDFQDHVVKALIADDTNLLEK